MKTEKLELAQGNASGMSLSRSGDNDDASVDDQVAAKQASRNLGDISQIEQHEGILVKQVQSLTPIIQKQILNNF